MTCPSLSLDHSTDEPTPFGNNEPETNDIQKNVPKPNKNQSYFDDFEKPVEENKSKKKLNRHDCPRWGLRTVRTVTFGRNRQIRGKKIKPVWLFRTVFIINR